MTMACSLEQAEAHDPTNSSDDAMSTGCKKGVPWSAAEHTAFLKGLQNLGKGNWRGISRLFVPSRSPTQVASHAQKYFLRLNGCTKRRSRFSGLEQGTMPPRPSLPKASAKALGSSASPTSSGEQPPVLQQPPVAGAPPAAPPMLPMPFMFPPMMFAMPGGAPFVHPMFYQAAMPHFAKGQGMMLPMMLPITPELAAKAAASLVPKQEGSDDSAPTAPDAAGTACGMQLDQPLFLCRPAARRSSDQGKTSELLNHLTATSTCQVALHASQHSAFRPPTRQLAAV